MEEDDMLLQLLEAKQTFLQIAKQIGVTRNAIAGRVSRLRAKHKELPPPMTRSQAATRANAKRKRKPKPASPPIAPEPIEPWTPEPPPENMSDLDALLYRLFPKGCRYETHGAQAVSPEQFEFCGARRWGLSPYCETHYHVCYVPEKPRNKKRGIYR